MKKLIYILLAFGFFGCEKEVVKIVYGPPISGVGDQKVLVEEFTGNTCTFCPTGTKELESLSELNPNKLVKVSIHFGHFAKPSSYSKYDLRTPVGSEIDKFLENSTFYPTASFNRVPDISGEYIFERPLWSNKIQALVSQTAKASLIVKTTFNETNRELKVLLNGIAKTDIKEDILANVLITESNIIDYQLDNGKNVPDYVHNNVLRTALTPIPGIKISSSPSIGDGFTKEFTFYLPVDWKAENCKVIGYLSYSSKKEIIQVEETDLK